jgi:hypothetical protein
MAFGGNSIMYSRIAAEVIILQITGSPALDADLFAYMYAIRPGLTFRHLSLWKSRSLLIAPQASPNSKTTRVSSAERMSSP